MQKSFELERVETWEYPIDAIREAVTNAICHRDYEEYANVQVRIFDDRVEIWGCGSLPEPLTVDDLKHSHRSILRNPLIGKCLFLIKIAVCARVPEYNPANRLPFRQRGLVPDAGCQAFLVAYRH